MPSSPFADDKQAAGLPLLGQHVIAEYYGCCPEILDDLDRLSELLVTAARRSGATPIKQEFHRFLPHGISGVVIITESHLTIHTWPEHRYAAVDFFTCGQSTDPLRAHEYLRQELCASAAHHVTLKRGISLNNGIESAAADAAIYQESLVAPAFVLAERPLRRVALLGGGEGATLREVLRFPEVQRCVLVEVDPELADRRKKQRLDSPQGAFADPRAELCFEDAYRFLERAAMKGEKYDLILCDLPEAEAGGPVAQLYSQSFFALLRNCLAPQGIYAGHMGSLQRTPSALGPQALLPVAAATFEWVMPYLRFLPSERAEWVFAVGGMAARASLPGPAEVDARLAQRRDPAWPCRTYDGETHQRLFSLSKDVRRALAPGHR